MTDLSTTRSLSFRGHRFLIACTEREGYQHPSWFSFEDEASVREAFWNIEPGDIVLDVGAAYGSYTLTALACGAQHVFSWSPEGPPGEPTEADMLTNSLELNGWLPRCTLFRQGCYDRRGWLDPLNQIFTEEPASTDGMIAVSCLEDYLAHHSQISKIGVNPRMWMKLDVEGAEVEVLRGSQFLVSQYRPKIIVENHLFKHATLAIEVGALLSSWGYKHVETRPYHSVSHSYYEP